MMSLVGRWRRKGIAVDFATLAATPTIEAWSQLVSAGTGVAPRQLPHQGMPGYPRKASLSRWRRCSTRCGSAATTTNSSAG
ncbi:phenyloxazoline synthase [Mycobacterium tuberculosis variant bovis BCG]|nr:phenyloxazoline synthase [Mycobacterium tuberculosis variant bovis BCG]